MPKPADTSRSPFYRTVTAFATLLLAAPAVGPLLPDAQLSAQLSADVEARIRRVEAGLLTPVVIAGQVAGMRLADRMRNYNVPGVSVAVINDGRIEWARGYGVLQAGANVAVDTMTLFQAASISKPVAAMAVLRLVQDGSLDLDADVNGLLRSWQLESNGHTAVQKVTLRRLLSHSAGLTVHGFRGYARGEDVPTLVQVLDGAAPANSARVRPDTEPGSIWRYSGGGSSVAQLLMQDVTGRTFPDLMRDLVLQPTGMMHSGYDQPLPEHRAPAAATGHRAGGAAVTGGWHTYPEMFAAGLWTTPSDLARLAIHVQQSFNGRPGILSPAVTREMLTVQAGEYGLGFGVVHGDGYVAFSHGGANEGFRATFYAFADRGQGAVVMTNGDAGSPLAAEILRAIATEYGWPAQRPVVRDVVAIDPGALASLAGAYRGEWNGSPIAVNFGVEGRTLRSQGAPLGARTLHHQGGDTFFATEAVLTVSFERDAAGRGITAFIPGPGGQRIRLAREH
jgi:CubicO group peptidase (beta-lactamase class C family)